MNGDEQSLLDSDYTETDDDEDDVAECAGDDDMHVGDTDAPFPGTGVGACTHGARRTEGGDTEKADDDEDDGDNDNADVEM